MTLGNKITTYRKQHLWSQEDLAEQLGVSRQSVSKWESGASVPELDKIILLAKVFGITTDELLLEDYAPTLTMEDPFGFGEPAPEAEKIPSSPTMPTVTKNEAMAYIQETKKQSLRFGPAVAACVISPTPLILLSGLADRGILPEGLSVGAGIAALLILVAAAVAVFITGGMALEQYKHIHEDAFQPEAGLTAMVEELRNEHTPTFTFSITLGVILCILAVLPLIVAAVMELDDLIILGTVDLMLVLIAIAVFLFVRAGMVRDCYYTPSNKKTEKRFGGPYWCLMTAIYLGLSFYTMAWHRTWILWPCAGVLYAAICGFLNAGEDK